MNGTDETRQHRIKNYCWTHQPKGNRSGARASRAKVHGQPRARGALPRAMSLGETPAAPGEVVMTLLNSKFWVTLFHEKRRPSVINTATCPYLVSVEWGGGRE